MNQIIENLKSGHVLKPMQNAGNFFEDGFYLALEKNGLTGFIEVSTSDVKALEKKGLIFFNANKWQHVLTKKGMR